MDEGDIAYLSCNSGTSIKTKSAFFGYNRNPKCEDSSALSVVQGLVDGLSDATVVASATSFTSTCAVGTAQQLIITYVCESSKSYHDNYVICYQRWKFSHAYCLGQHIFIRCFLFVTFVFIFGW